MNEAAPDRITILETPRVRLREFTSDDLQPLADMVGDPAQMRFYPRPRTKAEAESWIDRNMTLYKEPGFGFWCMESIDNEDFLGYCGIRPVDLDGVEEVEIGWHTRKEFWGQGLATEAAAACRDLAFARFDLDRLVGTIDPTHTASIRVAEKIGMEREGETAIDGWPCTVYAVGRKSLRGS